MTIQNGIYTQLTERPLGQWTLTVCPGEHGQVFVIESDHIYPEEVNEAYALAFILHPETRHQS